MQIEYIAPAPGEYPELTEEAAGKGLKRGLGMVLGIVASAFIPVVAPSIYGSLVTSLGLKSVMGGALAGTIGQTVGSALTGAILGGTTSALTGGDWRTGALMGGLSGGLGGFRAAGAISGPTTGRATPGVVKPTPVAGVAAPTPTPAPEAGGGLLGGSKSTYAPDVSKAAEIERVRAIGGGTPSVTKTGIAQADIQAPKPMPVAQTGIGRRMAGVVEEIVPRLGTAVAASLTGAAEEERAAARAREEAYRLNQANYARIQALAAEYNALADRADPESAARRAAVQQELAVLRAGQQSMREAAGKGYNQEKLRGIQRRARLYGARSAGLGAETAAKAARAEQMQAKLAGASLYAGLQAPTRQTSGTAEQTLTGLGRFGGAITAGLTPQDEHFTQGNLWGRG